MRHCCVGDAAAVFVGVRRPPPPSKTKHAVEDGVRCFHAALLLGRRRYSGNAAAILVDAAGADGPHDVHNERLAGIRRSTLAFLKIVVM